MSENLTEIAKSGGYDTRTFAEIWYSLPQAAKQMLYHRLVGKGIKKQNVYRWTHGSVPRDEMMRKLQQALLVVFKIKTLPYTLFPDREARLKIEEKLAKREAERTQWNGKVEWQTLKAVQEAEPNDVNNPEY